MGFAFVGQDTEGNLAGFLIVRAGAAHHKTQGAERNSYRRVVVGLTDTADGSDVAGTERGPLGRAEVTAGGSGARTVDLIVVSDVGGSCGEGVVGVENTGAVVVVVTRPTSAGPTMPGASTGPVSSVAPRVTPATAAATPPIPA